MRLVRPSTRRVRRTAGLATTVMRRLLGRGLRLPRRHPWALVGAAAALACALLAWLLGPGLEQWFVAEGMDSERADILSAMVLSMLATAVVAGVSRRMAPARLGGLVGFTGIQVVPFLVRAATLPATPGLLVRADVLGWVLQPIGMLLLGAISVVVGGALGIGLRRDAAGLPRLVRRHRLWPAAPVAAALVVAGSLAAVTALQEGPLGALRDYTNPVTGALPPGDSASADPATGRPAGSTPATPTPSPSPDMAVLRRLPGHVESLVVAGRLVVVYVPGVYASDDSLHLPVLYLLHGSPGDPEEWLGSGGQLQGVLDQLIGNGTIPPVLTVLPDGNGPASNDTEWGNSSQGQIESWLIDQVVPSVDAQFRTLGAAYRGIAGLSSGGFGAVNLALRHPTVFDWAGSYSGYFVANTRIFGTGAAWRANSPLYTAAGVPASERMPLYLGAGTQDFEFRAATSQFATTLRRLDWPDVDFQIVPGGHGWGAWQAELVQSLDWLGQLWGPQPGSRPGGGPSLPGSA